MQQEELHLDKAAGYPQSARMQEVFPDESVSSQPTPSSRCSVASLSCPR
jgi:hypothetical protein